MAYPIYYRVEVDWPHQHLFAGDLLRYDPTSSPEVVVFRRPHPNHGAILGAIEDGTLTPVAPDPTVVPLYSLRRSPPPTGPRPVRVLAFPESA